MPEQPVNVALVGFSDTKLNAPDFFFPVLCFTLIV